MLFDSRGDKGDAEPTVLIVIIGATIARELDGGAHLFEDLEVVVKATLGNADLVGTVGGFAGGL